MDLQGTLIGVRAVVEGFSFISTGFVVAGYYVVILQDLSLIPIFLKRVGHIRVFAALASLSFYSYTYCIQFFFNPFYVVFYSNILTGISLSGIYVIMESWLNDKSTNETRGKILSIYMIITFAFVGLGSIFIKLK